MDGRRQSPEVFFFQASFFCFSLPGTEFDGGNRQWLSCEGRTGLEPLEKQNDLKKVRESFRHLWLFSLHSTFALVGIGTFSPWPKVESLPF
jgi:hypothetical protein